MEIETKTLVVTAGAVIAVLVIIYFILRAKVNKNATNIAAEKMQEMTPVWAEQGPFENGIESSKAMWIAWAMTQGVEFAQSMEESLINHRNSYDIEPDQWERIRQSGKRENLPVGYSKEMIDTFFEEATRNGYFGWVLMDTVDKRP